MTHAEQITAALENWERRRYLCESLSSMAAGDEMAALLRESQPEPAPVVGDDEALLLEAQQCASMMEELYSQTGNRDYTDVVEVIDALTARLRAALADVARLTEELERERVRLAGCGVAALGYATGDNAITPDSYGWSASFGDVLELRQKYDEARAALAAAEQEKERAVAEEREDRLNVERSRARFFKERDEARAALHAAVVEETQACAQLCRDEADTSLVVDDEDRGYRDGLLWAEANIRARAGRNDG